MKKLDAMTSYKQQVSGSSIQGGMGQRWGGTSWNPN